MGYITDDKIGGSCGIHGTEEKCVNDGGET